MQHVHGQDNAGEDAISHVKLEANQLSLSPNSSNLDLLNMTQGQQDNAKVQAYRTAITKMVLAGLHILAPTQHCCAISQAGFHDPLSHQL